MIFPDPILRPDEDLPEFLDPIYDNLDPQEYMKADLNVPEDYQPGSG